EFDQRLEDLFDAAAPPCRDIVGGEAWRIVDQDRHDRRGDVGGVDEVAGLAAVAPHLDRPLSLDHPADEGWYEMGRARVEIVVRAIDQGRAKRDTGRYPTKLPAI